MICNSQKFYYELNKTKLFAFFLIEFYTSLIKNAQKNYFIIIIKLKNICGPIDINSTVNNMCWLLFLLLKNCLLQHLIFRRIFRNHWCKFQAQLHSDNNLSFLRYKTGKLSLDIYDIARHSENIHTISPIPCLNNTGSAVYRRLYPHDTSQQITILCALTDCSVTSQ